MDYKLCGTDVSLAWRQVLLLTPASWYHHLRDANGKVDWEAIAVLSLVVGEHLRVVEQDDGQDALFLLSIEPLRPGVVREYAEELGLTRGAVRRAIQRLQDRGLIKVEVVANGRANRRGSNGTYVEPIASKIVEITGVGDHSRHTERSA